MMLDKTCEERGIDFAYTSKLFYEQYTSSITVKLNCKKPDRNKFLIGTKATDINLPAYRKAKQAYADKRWHTINEVLEEINLPDTTPVKVNETSFTIYFECIKVCSTSLSQLLLQKRKVSKVVAPRNEREIAALAESPNKIIRPTLFQQDKFKYRVEMQISFSSRDYIIGYLHDVFGGDFTESVYNKNITKNLKIKTDQAHYRNGRFLYVNTEEDVFLLRLALLNSIVRVDEVILSKDI